MAGASCVVAADFQVWNNASMQGVLSGDLLFTADASLRYGEDATRLNQTVVRGGLGWRLSSRLTLWGGYALLRTRIPGADSLTEHRGWQQASYPILNHERIRLTGRTRLEQRRGNSRDGTS
jgi:hypothetical protein